MALTTLDPTTALLVVDLQKGIVGSTPGSSIDAVVERAKTLVDAFHAHRQPVAFIKVDGVAPGRTEQPRRDMGILPAGFTDLLTEFVVRPDDIVVTKRTWGAFTGTELEATLRAAGVTQIVLCGVATSIGVESTARQAHELGFNVALVVDAMTDLREDAHANSIALIFPRLGETGSSEEIIALLGKNH